MSVQEQTPFIEYTANGTTTIFPLTFDCSTSDYLVVKVNDVLQIAGTWALIEGNVVFNLAPIAGSLVSIQRITPLKRTTSYQSYDNSFRPEPVDKDFDNIWYVLQEFAVTNSLTLDKLQELIDKLVDGEINGLPAEILARIAGDEANITLINQEELRAYAAEANLDFKINTEATRAQAIETAIQNQVDSIVVGNKAYRTYALMNADKANIPVNSKVSVTNDSDTTKNIDWQWNGVDFSPASPNVLTQAKNYTDTRIGELINSPPVDLFTKTNKITGSYINKSGVQTSSASWSCSGFLPVKYRDVIIYNASANNVVAFIAAYDANRAFLRELVSTANSAVTILNGQKEIETDVKFIRVSFYTASSTTYSFQHKPFEFETDMLNKSEVSDLVYKQLTAPVNLFDPVLAKDGYALINNVETVTTGWLISDYIPVISNETYTANGSGYKDPGNRTGVHYFDASKVLINTTDTAQQANIPFSVPSTAKFMRINFVKASSPTTNNIVVSQGMVATKTGRLEDLIKAVAGSGGGSQNRYLGKILSILGDSISDHFATPFTYPPIVSDYFGMTLIDMAISGTRVRSSFVRSNATDANFLATNILLIAHGTNDFKIETPIGNITDTPTSRALLGDPTYTTAPVGTAQENHLFDPSTAIDGSYLLNNVLTSDANWFVSDFIAVRSQIKYTSNGSAVGDAAAGVHFYDSSKNFISYGSLNTTGIPFSVPSGVAFIRVNFKKANSRAIAKTSVAQGTFYADYRGVIESVLAININARIMLMTPIKRSQPAWTGTDTNSFGHKLIDYTDAIIEIGKYYSLPVLDNYRTSGFNHLNIVALSNLNDGLHPNAWAQANIMAQKVIGFINSN